MPSTRNHKTKKPDAPHPAKNNSAPSKPEQLQIATLETNDTPDGPGDALRNQWASIVAEFDSNIEAFTAYVDEARERIERNHGWTGGTDLLRTFINDSGFVTPKGNDFRVTHGHDTVWLREVCRRWPDVAPHILPTLKPSKFDTFYPDLFGGEDNA